jgi:creatinine amidohydrolase/Fe(II)-dependent formamide hydrolase-like protein
MRRSPPSRSLGDLTFPEVSRYLKETSILCLPLGAIEQHGPHLPLNTDVVIAEGLTRRIVARWGDDLDLWQLPTVALGLSREHDWAPGTMSLTLESFIGLVEDMAHEIVRSLPARNLLIVNGHGGNGAVQHFAQEWAADHPKCRVMFHNWWNAPRTWGTAARPSPCHPLAERRGSAGRRGMRHCRGTRARRRPPSRRRGGPSSWNARGTLSP